MGERGVDARNFWEDKILVWERDRYGGTESTAPTLERVASRASDSLRFRIKKAGGIIGRHAAGKRIVELGCGSAMLAEGLIEAGAQSYRGYDIAANAVNQATRRIADAGLGEKISFIQSDIPALPALEADIVFSLGLFDWLSPAEIERIFELGDGAGFLHSISERRASPKQWLHKLYVHIAYGYRTGGYVPRYYAAEDIAAIAHRHGHAMTNIYRDRRLSFGILLSSLEFD